MEHMSTQCNDAYGIVQISQSTQPPLCTSENDQNEEDNVIQNDNIQLLSNDPTNHCRADMSEYTNISNNEPSLDKEGSAPDYEIVQHLRLKLPKYELTMIEAAQGNEKIYTDSG